jgi:N-dimethylarginine dimethylaminohydrolase
LKIELIQKVLVQVLNINSFLIPLVFSISPKVVVSEQNFNRLNNFMETEWGLTVERVPYHEISKMGGLLRCSTLPLIRQND